MAEPIVGDFGNPAPHGRIGAIPKARLASMILLVDWRFCPRGG